MRDYIIPVTLKNGEVFNLVFEGEKPHKINDWLEENFEFSTDDEWNLQVPKYFRKGLENLSRVIAEVEQETGEEFSRSFTILKTQDVKDIDVSVLDKDIVNSDMVPEEFRVRMHAIYGDKNILGFSPEFIKSSEKQIHAVITHESAHAQFNHSFVLDPRRAYEDVEKFFDRVVRLSDDVQAEEMEDKPFDKEEFSSCVLDLHQKTASMQDYVLNYEIDGKKFDVNNLNHANEISKDDNFSALNSELVLSVCEMREQTYANLMNNSNFQEFFRENKEFILSHSYYFNNMESSFVKPLFNSIKRSNELEADNAVDKYQDSLIDFFNEHIHEDRCVRNHPNRELRVFNVKMDKITDSDSPGGENVTVKELLREFGSEKGWKDNLFGDFAGKITCSEVENGDVSVKYNGCNNVSYNITPEDKKAKDLLLGK